MKLYARFKVKQIRVNGVSQRVQYDRVENLPVDEAWNTDRFPNGQQLEDDGVAYLWGYDKMKEA